MKFRVPLLFSLLFFSVAQTSSPTTKPSSNISWLAVYWAGPQDETIPPLVFYLTNADVRIISANIPTHPPLIHVTPRDLHAIAAWLAAHPPTPLANPEKGFFQVTLGDSKGVVDNDSMSSQDARAFFHAMDKDLPLSPLAKSAAADFASSFGL